jgi:CelD/BcsL family acetyltransferase involved in cellulose biosynthesis
MATALRQKRRTRPASARGELELIRARTRDELERLEGPWRALDAEGRLPSAHFGWARAAWTAFAEEAAVEIVAVVRAGRLVGMAPLVQRRHHGVGRSFVLGANGIEEPMELAATDDTVRRRLAEALVARPLALDRIPAGSPTLHAIKRACRGRAVVVTRPAAAFAYLPLDESWIEPQQHLNGYCRSQLRRARLEAEQFGPLATEIHSPGLHDLPRLLDAVLEVGSRGREGKSGRATERDPRRAVFYRQCAQAACLDGTLRVSLLRIGEAVAAAEMAIESGGGYWRLMAAEDGRFSDCLAGQLLARETIRYAAEANLSTYAFWGRPQHWTAAWTAHKQECVSLWSYPLNIRGLGALATDGIALCWRRKRRDAQAGTST